MSALATPAAAAHRVTALSSIMPGFMDFPGDAAIIGNINLALYDLPGTIAGFPCESLGVEQSRGENAVRASRPSSNRRASGPIFVSAWRLLA